MDIRNAFQQVYSLLKALEFQSQDGIKVTSGEVDLCGVDYDELNAVKFMLIAKTACKLRRLLERIEKDLSRDSFQC